MLTPILVVGYAIDCSSVAMPAHFLNIGSCMEAVVQFPDIIRSVVDTIVTS
jgi:hypothetical protein